MEYLIGKTDEKSLLSWLNAEKKYREKRKNYDPKIHGDLNSFLIKLQSEYLYDSLLNDYVEIKK